MQQENHESLLLEASEAGDLEKCVTSSGKQHLRSI